MNPLEKCTTRDLLLNALIAASSHTLERHNCNQILLRCIWIRKTAVWPEQLLVSQELRCTLLTTLSPIRDEGNGVSHTRLAKRESQCLTEINIVDNTIVMPERSTTTAVSLPAISNYGVSCDRGIILLRSAPRWKAIVARRVLSMPI